MKYCTSLFQRLILIFRRQPMNETLHSTEFDGYFGNQQRFSSQHLFNRMYL
jgi:hypothetical protein